MYAIVWSDGYETYSACTRNPVAWVRRTIFFLKGELIPELRAHAAVWLIPRIYA